MRLRVEEGYATGVTAGRVDGHGQQQEGPTGTMPAKPGTISTGRNSSGC